LKFLNFRLLERRTPAIEKRHADTVQNAVLFGRIATGG
jgi:hypothetical protein